MKTRLPKHIANLVEAIVFLRTLHENGELFDPCDNPALIPSLGASPEELAQLNHLTRSLFEIPGFDPYQYMLLLDYSGARLKAETHRILRKWQQESTLFGVKTANTFLLQAVVKMPLHAINARLEYNLKVFARYRSIHSGAPKNSTA